MRLPASRMRTLLGVMQLFVSVCDFFAMACIPWWIAGATKKTEATFDNDKTREESGDVRREML